MLDEVDTEEIIKKWELVLGRSLTDDEKEVIELTEGEIDLRLGYCPSVCGDKLNL